MQKVNQIKQALNALNLLRRDTKHMVSMETHHGMGDVLVRTYMALQQSVNDVVDNPFVAALKIDLPEDADDRLKVTQVTILAGQLLAFVEAYYEEIRQSEANEALSEDEQINQRFNELMDD